MKFLKEGFDVFVLGVCQEDVLENLIDENYTNQVLTPPPPQKKKKKAQRRVL